MQCTQLLEGVGDGVAAAREVRAPAAHTTPPGQGRGAARARLHPGWLQMAASTEALYAEAALKP